MNNLLAKTDRKQQTIGYGYDALYRLTGKTYPDQRRMVSGGEWCQSAISLSQTKWFLTPFSRQWMTGYAARPLAAPSDREPPTTSTIGTPGDPHPASGGESPFPLDLYLSWMTPFSPDPSETRT